MAGVADIPVVGGPPEVRARIGGDCERAVCLRPPGRLVEPFHGFLLARHPGWHYRAADVPLPRHYPSNAVAPEMLVRVTAGRQPLAHPGSRITPRRPNPRHHRASLKQATP